MLSGSIYRINNWMAALQYYKVHVAFHIHRFSCKLNVRVSKFKRLTLSTLCRRVTLVFSYLARLYFMSSYYYFNFFRLFLSHIYFLQQMSHSVNFLPEENLFSFLLLKVYVFAIYLYSLDLFCFCVLQILTRASSHFKVGCGYRATVLAVGDNNLELTIAGN